MQFFSPSKQTSYKCYALHLQYRNFIMNLNNVRKSHETNLFFNVLLKRKVLNFEKQLYQSKKRFFILYSVLNIDLHHREINPFRVQ